MASFNGTLSDQLNISLRRVNRDLERIILHDPDVPSRSIVAKSVLDLIRAGGKRLRPMMTIVGSRFGNDAESDDVYRLASAAELIHVASLIHDDILDQSDTRRGEPALHCKTGIYNAVHIGNYIMCRVIELMTSSGKDHEPYAHDLASITTTQLCLGEYQQMELKYNFDLSLDAYWEKTRNKTALLMATCLQLGAKAAGAVDEVVDQLYAFGDQLGMAFQVRDDILDFTQSSESLGKPSGVDLRNGHATLPAILAMRDASIAAKLHELKADSPDEAFNEAIELIHRSGSLEEALQMSHAFMKQAWEITEQLSAYPAHRDLKTLWYYFEARTY